MQFKLFFIYRRIAVLSLLALLQACGGGNELQPAISEVKAQSLQFGKTASIQVAGKYLRSDMVAQTGSCTAPTFAASSTPDLAVLNCKVTATGALPITISSASGELLFATTLTVKKPEVLLLTAKGNIVIELDPNITPVSVNNFLAYVSKGFYQSSLFHRVIPGFVIQAGGYTAGMVKKDGLLAPITLESNKGWLNTRGTVAMARTALPDSATSQFFINLVDNTSLNYQSAASPGYAVFGRVVQGFDVMDAIAAVPTAVFQGIADVPTTDMPITLAAQIQ
jgi:peptidyl-prolyl cis-trans isomerase A (cyclophilin A)